MSIIAYDALKYQAYMHLPLIDEAKKHLELQLVGQLLRELASHEIALDIGTATGRYPQFLLQQGFRHTVGIDLSEEAISIAKQNLQQAGLLRDASLFLMNADKLEFPEDTFDLVTCMMGTFCHTPADSKLTVLKEACRVLRPAGMVMLTCWDPECSFTDFLSMYGEQERAALMANTLPSSVLVDMVQQAGFADVQTQAICCLTDEQLRQLGLELGFQPLERLHNQFWRWFPDLKGQLYMVRARKSRQGGIEP